jgi:hypothetical protein
MNKKLVVFLEENLNKNTKTKTKSDMKVITDFFTSISIGEERAPGQIHPPPKDIDSIMARFFLGVLKKDGTGYEPDSLGSVYNSLDRHLRDMKSPIGYVLTFLSFKLVNIHHKFT